MRRNKGLLYLAKAIYYIIYDVFLFLIGIYALCTAHIITGFIVLLISIVVWAITIQNLAYFVRCYMK